MRGEWGWDYKKQSLELWWLCVRVWRCGWVMVVLWCVCL
jgi:hypothetical protein